MESHYRAFISYSHSDEVWASWLQRALERYRVPGRLRTVESGLPTRLHPIFRDREELASSDDLSESIRSALIQSETLLVVCSPAAVASRWVNEEIHAFRRIAPGRRILCLMVEGSPEAFAEDCAFPAALLKDEQGNDLPEPLAADVRPQADGKRGAFLKIVAGLLGVGVDALRQRDQQRRFRVVTGIAAVATAVAMVTVLLALSAMEARNEAELRRAQAEELIRFMLVDLREQLEPIGRLNILDKVGDQAETYFQALGDLGSNDDVFSRAMALRQIGEVRFNQGHLEPALKAFTQSRDLSASLLKLDPENYDTLFELGQSEFWVGYVAWERADLDSAEIAFRAYSDISTELSQRDPENPDYLMELVYAAHNLGGLAMERGQSVIASQHIADSVEIGRRLVSGDPGSLDKQLELARSLSWLGRVLKDRGELQHSLTALREGVVITQALHEKGEDADHSKEFGDLLLLLANTNALVGDLDNSMNQFSVAVTLFTGMVEDDPENTLWKEGLYRSLVGAGQVALMQGQLKQGATWLESAMNGFLQLSRDQPENRVFRTRAARTAAYAAIGALRNIQEALALKYSETAYKWLQEVLVKDAKLTSNERLRSANTLDLCGEVWADTGSGDRALKAWNEGLQLLIPAPQSSLIEKALYVRLMHRLGRATEVADLLVEIQQTGLNDDRYLPSRRQ